MYWAKTQWAYRKFLFTTNRRIFNQPDIVKVNAKLNSHLLESITMHVR